MNEIESKRTRVCIVDIDKSIEKILDRTRPTLIRAVDLYALSVAILTSRGARPRKASGSSDRLLVRKGILRTARAIACMHLLGLTEDKMDKVRAKSPILRFGEKEYAKVLREFFKNGGWAQINEINNLYSQILKARIRAQSVARLIDFSVRFTRGDDSGAHKGGITTAINYAPYLPGFYLNMAPTKLWTLWGQSGHSGVWFWLHHARGNDLIPPLPLREDLATLLLDQLETNELGNAIDEYNCVYDALKHHEGYRGILGKMSRAISIQPINLSFDPLPKNWRQDAEFEMERRKQMKDASKIA